MTAVVVRPLDDAEALADLARDAEQDGHRMVSHLMGEWRDGSNRYSAPGEQLYAAAIDDRIVGVCGLNIDPYAEAPAVGRVRHLYILQAHRRLGVGRQLVAAVLDAARGRFRCVRLRTTNPAAARLYESLGFRPSAGQPDCTHLLESTVSTP